MSYRWLTDLPSDILVLICGFVPLQPRMLLLSCTCTKLRSAALLSITEVLNSKLAFRLQELSIRLLSQKMTNLTSISSPSATWPVGLSLRIEALSSVWLPDRFECTDFPRLTSLRHMDDAHDQRNVPALRLLIERCATTLRELTVPGYFFSEGSYTTPLPHLTKLCVNKSVFSPEALIPLLPQLTSLIITPVPRAVTPYLTLALPLLLRLKIHIYSDVDAPEGFATWISSLPSLTYLKVHFLGTGCVLPFLRHLSTPCLVEAKYPPHWNERVDTDRILEGDYVRQTRLQRISVFPSGRTFPKVGEFLLLDTLAILYTELHFLEHLAADRPKLRKLQIDSGEASVTFTAAVAALRQIYESIRVLRLSVTLKLHKAFNDRSVEEYISPRSIDELEALMQASESVGRGMRVRLTFVPWEIPAELTRLTALYPLRLDRY